MTVSRPVLLGVALFIVATFFIGFFLGKTLLHPAPEQPSVVVKETPARIAVSDSRIVRTHFVAIDNNGKGVLGQLSTEIRPGTGLVLVNINNILADFNTQYSARVAAQVAKNYTGIDLHDIDIIFNLQADASIIGGQSAGSIMTASAIAGLMNRTIRDDVLITGAIKENGEVGEAGAIKEKATAAKEAHARLFLVAPGEASEASSLRKEKACSKIGDFDFCKVMYTQEKVNLGDSVGIEFREVKTMQEALGYLLT